jgi:hypothetical protein
MQFFGSPLVASRNRLLRIHATKGAMFAGGGAADPKSGRASRVLRLPALEIATLNFAEFLFFFPRTWVNRGKRKAEASLRSPGSVNDYFTRSCLYLTPQSRPLLLASRLPGTWTSLLAHTTPSS